MKSVSILGSSGSIGKSTLKIIEEHLDHFKIHLLMSGSNWQEVLISCQKFSPKYVYLADPKANLALQNALKAEIIFLNNEEELRQALAEEHDICISAIAGSSGLMPTMYAMEGCRMLGIVNKESIVCAGKFIKEKAKAKNVNIIPLDSEHSAIFQALQCGKKHEIKEVIITASGDPFWNLSQEEMVFVGLQDALKHPNWNMGPKNTIDSATLMNKGLEFIEACELFDLPPEKVSVMVHPQSILHGMVTFYDGSSIAQLGMPDMKTPISLALGYPERMKFQHQNLNLLEVQKLEFFAPDHKRFPLLKLAIDTYSEKDLSKVIALNMLNELAIRLFMENKITFLGIADYIIERLAQHQTQDISSLEEVLTYIKTF